METEIVIVAWGAILLLVHVFAAGHFKTKQYGAKWNTGARDEALPPMHPLTGRLVRAQANFQETFPLAIVALLGVVVAGRTSQWTEIGGWVWLGARVVYLPLYALSTPIIRSLVFLVSIAGILTALWPLLFASPPNEGNYDEFAGRSVRILRKAGRGNGLQLGYRP